MTLNLRRNVIYSFVETAATAASLFVVYKIILTYLPLSALGLWSILGATVSMARLGDLGMADSLTRILASNLNNSRRENNVLATETAVVSVGLLYTVIAIAAYFPVRYAMSALVDAGNQAAADNILPIILITFVVSNTANAIAAGLSGLLRSYTKSRLSILGNIVLVSSSLILIPQYGLMGVALGQLTQSAFNCIANWIFIRRELPGLSAVPYKLDFNTLKSLLKFGAQLQVASIAIFFFEPILKIAMTNLAGLEATGLLELAGRIIQQLRALIVASNRTLIATFAHLYASNPIELGRIFSRSVALTLAASAVLLGGAAVGAPVISLVLLDSVSPLFALMLAVLGAGWIVNTAAVPIYMLGIGVGRLKYNTISQLTIAATNGPLCWWLGGIYGALGVVTGAMIALIAGTAILVLGYITGLRQVAAFENPLRDLFRK